MKDISQAKFCIIDHGLNVSLAQKMAEKADHVWYHTPYEEGFSIFNHAVIGDGFETFERCNDPWAIKNDIDCWIFPDIEHAGWQNELISQGRAVWGSRYGDSLELFREKFHKVLEHVGLDVPKFKSITGITNLRLFLMDNEGPFYIKMSRYRGSFETCKFRSWDEDKGLLDLWAVRFGPCSEIVDFMVFDPIETDLEIGGDTYNVRGEWPEVMLRGDESKDTAYLSAVTERDKMPQQILDVLEAFGPILGEYGYCNFWSMEIRVAEDKAFFGDATTRGPFPALPSQLEAFENIAEIIWAGANGEMVQPKSVTKHTGELILTLKGDKKVWGSITVPEELQQWLKLQDCCKVDKQVCFPLNDDGERSENIGWLVGLGDTLDEVIDVLQERIDLLPDGVCAEIEPLAHLLKEIEAAKQEGIDFDATKIPDPTTVIDNV